MTLSTEELAQLANLAKLEIDGVHTDQIQKKIDYFLTLAHRLTEIELHDTQPLTHPLDVYQPLRKDTATVDAVVHNEQTPTVHVRDSLYIVPAVLESSN